MWLLLTLVSSCPVGPVWNKRTTMWKSTDLWGFARDQLGMSDTRLVELDIDPVTGLVRWQPRPLPGPPHSVAEVLAPVVASDPNRLALIDGDRMWTYAELDAAVADAAGRLAGAGLEQGEVILWSTPNCAELIVAFLASQRLGAIWAALSPKTVADERARIVELLDPRVAVLGLDAFGELDDRSEFPEQDADPLAPAAVGFTSGSTGTPKAVVHSQHSLLVPAHVSRAVEPPEPGERVGTPLALTTLNMMVLGPLSALVRGSTAVVMTRTDAHGLAAEVERHRVDRAFLVPTVLYDLVAAEIEPEQLDSLRRVIAGASGARPEVLRGFGDRFGVRPTLSYGLSEAPTGVVRESLDDPIGSGRGFPLPHVDVTIDDEGGEEEIVIGPATTGEWAGVWTPMLGYWGDPSGTATAIRNGRLHTGDIGEIDSEGGLRVLGRRDDVINRGGELISPRRVEAALEGLPEIVEAAVVGVPDDRLGEVVAALVVLAPDAEVPDLSDPVPRTHVPAVVQVTDALPRLSMGKVDRAEVRRRLGG